MGTPQYIEPQKKTRQVYVLEITKALPAGETKKIEEQTATTTKTTVEVSGPSAQLVGAPVEHHDSHKIIIPKIEDDAAAPVVRVADKVVQGPTEATTYTVVKDDTLQKIAAKFYGSHRAWYKIYKANKEKIKNPNVVRPGTVLTIPAVK
ncbi:MAG: LysM peptidoglycan-binding domain-containing protein [Candidatus Omnitrophica bacterium]|nr:LysM peptidoglycan-binding domain-containing protein [Candidatus Omnitrophota bacterium]